MLAMSYKTLTKQEINVANFNKKEEAFLGKMIEHYAGKPDWIGFKNRWHSELRNLYKDLDGKAFVNKGLYRIYQDLASRLGVEQNEVRIPDYRDRLIEIIEKEYKSHYEFCKQLKIDEGFLSKIRQKKKHLSIVKLQNILGKFGYKLEIEKIDEESLL